MDVFQQLIIGDSAFSIRIPTSTNSPPVVVGLHGLTGDEEAMGIFASRIPKEYLVLLPRGFHSSPLGGYSWVSSDGIGFPTVTEFRNSTVGLERAINLTLQHLSITPSQFHLMGFSQGAAFAYAVLSSEIWEVGSISSISGFMPPDLPGLIDGHTLNSLMVFIAHGSRDAVVPIEHARHAVRTFTQAGASVTFCEADVGHKLSASCFSALHQFYRGLI